MAIPNTTPTPNELYNGEMKKMSDTELRVVLIITRSTLGWILDRKTGMRKQEDWISNYQLREKSGRSGRAISTAIDNCIKNKWIEARNKDGELLDTKEKRSGKKIYYRLGEIFLSKITSENSSKVEKQEKKPVKIFPSTSENSSIENSSLYKRNSYTKETIQKRRGLTPSEKMNLFLEDKNFFNSLAEKISQKSEIPIDVSIRELKNFKGYWTELNKSGKKQRWELERTFELKRRLGTWFNNVNKFNKTKGKKILI